MDLFESLTRLGGASWYQYCGVFTIEFPTSLQIGTQLAVSLPTSPYVRVLLTAKLRRLPEPVGFGNQPVRQSCPRFRIGNRQRNLKTTWNWNVDLWRLSQRRV